MNDIILTAHNLLRWVFLAAAVYAIYRAFSGMKNKSPFGKEDKSAGAILLGTAHTQLLIGIILWFSSDKVQQALTDFGGSMHVKDLRFSMLEHPLTMIVAVALIQFGRIKSKKAYADIDKHKRCLINYGIALVLVLSRIPWNAPMFRF